MATSKLIMSSSASTSSRKSDLHRNPIIRPEPTARSDLQRRLVMNDAGSEKRSFGKSSTITVVEMVRDTSFGLAGDGQTGDGSSGGALDGRDGSLLNADITLLDAAGAITPIVDVQIEGEVPAMVRKKTAADVWREIVAGGESDENGRVECKEEAVDEMMTLEAFLVKAGAVDEGALMADVEGEVKAESALSGELLSLDTPYMSRQGSLDSVGMLGYSDGSVGLVGRGKRRGANLFEPLDKAAQQRQKRMIKNRESAARSRERKQAYQNELESMAVRLEEENEQLLKEKVQRTRARRKMLMEKVIPVEEKRKPARSLRRVCSMVW